MNEIQTIVADGDLDGLIAASILKICNPEASVHFAHAAEIRNGHLDSVIDRNTVICDLPFHPQCGFYLDHHSTNKPSDAELDEFLEAGGRCEWKPEDSAARVAFDLFCDSHDLTNLGSFMEMVDKLDSGNITLEEFRSDDPVLWLSRTISLHDPEYVHSLLEWFSSGRSLASILAEPDVAQRIAAAMEEQYGLHEIIRARGHIIDRLAIVRMEDSGLRTNGYLVTASFGDECDACCIVHGWSDGSIGDHSRPPLSASFYCNSFLHDGKGVFDLTRMARLLDESGGGHANACGCRVMPLDESLVSEQRPSSIADVERNISLWLEEWSTR